MILNEGTTRYFLFWKMVFPSLYHLMMSLAPKGFENGMKWFLDKVMPKVIAYVIFIWAFIGFYYLFKYYSKEKALSIIENYKVKALIQRRIWAIITLLSFLLPIILIFIILIKFR